MINPYATNAVNDLGRGFFGNHANCREQTFLFRVLEITHPINAEFVYSGWWFRQTIHVDGIRVWRQISWLSIKSKAKFDLPSSVDPEQREGRIEIDFSRGLRIRRFRLWIESELIYDEVS